jgi:hypothetical protein
MKLLMLTGAFAGFATALTAGWFQHVPWPTLLWRAALAAYLTSLLAGWWGRHWSHNLLLAQKDQTAVPAPPSPRSSPDAAPRS